MNRLAKTGLTPSRITVVLFLTLLCATGVQAEPDKRPVTVALPAAGGTISASLVCQPTTATLPASINLSSTTYNQTDAPRFCYGRVDLQTAGGLYMAAISAGTISLPAGQGEFVQVGWFKPLPARINHVGQNRYIFTVSDISAPPLNQPPYPSSGSTGTAQCLVTGVIP